MAQAMSSKYRDQLTTALFHAKAATRCLEKACASLGVDVDDDDEPVEESGLIPPPPESDFAGPDYIEPTTPLDPDLENPQSRARGRYIRLMD
jgi:hypothetical protein